MNEDLFHKILDMINRISSESEVLHEPVDGAHEEFDAITSGLNMLSEELNAKSVSVEIFELIINNLSDMIILFDNDLKVKLANQSALDLLGYSSLDLNHKHISEIIASDITLKILQNQESLLNLRNLESFLYTRKGKKLPVFMTFAENLSSSLFVKGTLCIFRNLITEKELQSDLILQDQIIKNISDGICLFSTTTAKIVYANEKLYEMFEINIKESDDVMDTMAPFPLFPRDSVDAPMSEAMHKKGYWDGQTNFIKHSGDELWCHTTVSLIEHSDWGTLFLIIHKDITAMKKLEQQLETMMMTDPLTRLHNRKSLMRVLEREYLRSVRSKLPLSCLMIDIDFFKQFNDTYGHDKGDHCLTTVSHLLQSEFKRNVDYIFRYGGEEFVVLLLDTRLEDAQKAAQLVINKMFKQNVSHASSPFEKVTLSIGVATLLFNVDFSLEKLLKYAEIALLDAKQKGRNRISLFTNNT